MGNVRLTFFLLLVGCKAAPVATSYEQFSAPVGEQIPPGCTKAADGKRFTLEGSLHFGETISIDEKDFVDLVLSPAADGKRRGVTVSVKTGRDIDDLGAQMQQVKTAGFRRTEGALPLDALRIHTTDGLATPGDVLKVTFEVEAITHFQTHEVTACVLHFVEATKR